MKKITLAMLLMASLNAQSGDFQNIQLKVDTCNFFAKYAGTFYDMRMRGEPPVPKNDGGTHMDLIKLYTIDYAWGEATSKQDAYNHVMAKCMDNFDWAVGSDKMEMARPERLHY